MASPALAADYDLPILRGSSQPPAPVVTVGPATFTRWSGFYFGGDFSFNNSTANFSSATQSLVAFSLRELALESEQHPSQWPVLGNGTSNAFGVGGFLGYNTQWQDLILGVEATYTRTNLNTTASPSPIGFGASDGRVVSAGGAGYTVNLTGTGNLNLTDYATARARAGYVVGNLLPYGFMGVAVGRASYSVTTRVAGQQSTAAMPFPLPGPACDPTLATCVNYDESNAAGQSNALLYGFSVGAGLDWALTQNIFLRGEFEFVQFAPISNISVYIMDARAGAGLKF
ncbi:MAG: outer membrane protein [Xanthobacteraceae bacterium]